MIVLESHHIAAILKLSASSSLDDVEVTLEFIANEMGVPLRSWLEWTDGGIYDRSLISMTTERFNSGAYEALVAFAFHRFLPKMINFSGIRELFQAFSESIQILNACEPNEKTRADERAAKIVASVISAAGPAALAACSFAAAGSSDRLLLMGWEHAQSLRTKDGLLHSIKDPDVSGGSKTL